MTSRQPDPTTEREALERLIACIRYDVSGPDLMQGFGSGVVSEDTQRAVDAAMRLIDRLDKAATADAASSEAAEASQT
ncbi:MAG: hypothetical protein AAF764_00790 [Pseudomonadota bacterium]